MGLPGCTCHAMTSNIPLKIFFLMFLDYQNTRLHSVVLAFEQPEDCRLPYAQRLDHHRLL